MSLRIRDSMIVTGSKLVKNDFYVEHFKGILGKDISEFLENSLGRNERYIADNLNENTLTLGAKAADKLLEKNGLTGREIDCILFCSQFPEFTVPTQSCMIHSHIKGKEKCIVLDLNSNCLGMLRGLDVINSYFNDSNSDIRLALLIGADSMSIHSQIDEPTTYANFGDGACAVLLEHTFGSDEGVIGSETRTISYGASASLFPECGMSSIGKYNGESNKLSWATPDLQPIINSMKEALDEILLNKNLKKDCIDWLCASQFSYALFEEIRKTCGIQKEKGIYVGDKYGYTGTSSPFFAYTEGIKQGKIKKGDIVFFTTVGVGYSICSMLLKV